MGYSRGLQSLFQINRCLTRIKPPSLTTQLQLRKGMTSIASFKVPVIANEPNVSFWSGSSGFELLANHIIVETLHQRFYRQAEATRCNRSSKESGPA